jgi:hypothetical protein
VSDKISMGGLLRCCLGTLAAREKPGTEGEVQPCKWCTESMVFRAGAWKWDHPKSQGFAVPPASVYRRAAVTPSPEEDPPPPPAPRLGHRERGVVDE